MRFSLKKYLPNNMSPSSLGKDQSGFTLIELVTVIIILGILSVGISRFLKFGSQIYIEAVGRDQILSSARFAIERFNREMRNALPNSSRIINYNGNHCIEFTPVIASSVYVDIPVAPEPASRTVSLVPATTRISASDAQNVSVVVYPLNPDDVYLTSNNKRYPVDSADFSGNPATEPYLLTLDNDILFAQDSATERLYFVDHAVMFCREEQGSEAQLVRYEVNGHNSSGSPTVVGPPALMAEYLTSDTEFRLSAASQQRNATVHVKMMFSRHNESITFNIEVQVPNVP